MGRGSIYRSLWSPLCVYTRSELIRSPWRTYSALIRRQHGRGTHFNILPVECICPALVVADCEHGRCHSGRAANEWHPFVDHISPETQSTPGQSRYDCPCKSCLVWPCITVSSIPLGSGWTGLAQSR
jgi:hypothetical protein